MNNMYKTYTFLFNSVRDKNRVQIFKSFGNDFLYSDLKKKRNVHSFCNETYIKCFT